MEADVSRSTDAYQGARTFKIVGDCYITHFEGFEQLSTMRAVRPVSIV